MTYDSQGRLTRLVDSINNVTTNFVYDFTGRLVKSAKTVGTSSMQSTIYVSDNYEVDAVTTGTDNPITTTTSYLVHNHRLASLAATGTTEQVRYYFHDRLGSTVALFDGDGNNLTYYDYDAFGNATASTPANDTARYKYSGKQLFSGFHYFGARFYDPTTGRFLTLDNFPIDLDGISPPFFNRYTFSWNDPINYVDWNGNEPVVPWWHWVIDIGMIVGGILVFPWNPILGGALASGGVSGLITDINAEISGENDNWAWGAQVYLGTALGAFGGWAGGYVGSSIRAGGAKLFWKGGQLISRGTGVSVARQASGVAASYGWKITSKVLADVALGAVLGGTQQVLTNLNDISRGKEGVGMFSGVGESVLWGVVGGAAIGALGRGARKGLIAMGLRKGLGRQGVLERLAAREKLRAEWSHAYSDVAPLAIPESLDHLPYLETAL